VALWDRWVLAQTRQEACDRLETAVTRPGRVKTNKHKLGSFEVSRDQIICYSFPGRLVLECPFSYEDYPLDKQVIEV
jgi:hypothetical protein